MVQGDGPHGHDYVNIDHDDHGYIDVHNQIEQEKSDAYRQNGQLANRHRHHSRGDRVGESIMRDGDIVSENGDTERGETRMGSNLNSEFGHHRHHGNSREFDSSHFHIDTKDMGAVMDMFGKDSRHGHKHKNKSGDRFRTNHRGVNQYRLGRHAN